MARQNSFRQLVVLCIVLIGIWGTRAEAAPTGKLKIGWMPAGSYSQMQYTDQSGITIGSTIRVTVDVTWNNSEGQYNITPGGVEFKEDAGHPGQIQSCSGGSLEKTTLYDTPSQGQTTVRFQAVGWPTQQAHQGGMDGAGDGDVAME